VSAAAPVGARYVEHVMGLPISLAMRGRHAADAAGRSAWAEVMDSLRAADEVFSTYRPQSVVSRLGRGELTLADCPPEVAEVLALGRPLRRTPTTRSASTGPGPTAGWRSTRAGW
jgi:FAD:protein FMN transferase